MFRKDEKGVSPVIGVILMVAITVILAAVIAAFVFGLGGQVETKKSPAISVKRINSTAIQLTLQDKGGASTIQNVDITSPYSATDVLNATDPWDVGETVTLNNAALTSGSHLVVVAEVDGEDQVILDTTI
jgi:flagellin-like protein